MAADCDATHNNGSGWLDGESHVFPVRVYYEDTDAGGIVYHASYLRFAERARTEMMRCLGGEHRRLMEDAGVGFAVRECAAEFFLPARLDDPLTVRTRVEALGGASMRLVQSVRDAAPRELVRLRIRLACVDAALRPARFPVPVRAAFAGLVADGRSRPARSGKRET